MKKSCLFFMFFLCLGSAYSQCINPGIPKITVITNPICDNDTTILFITGSLNDAAYWQWYTQSCGGVAVDTGWAISVSPSVNTTYYARGEGGCIPAPGLCGNATVFVGKSPSVFISGDTVFCNGDSSVLIANTEIGNKLVWSTGATTTSITVFTSGTYTVTVYNNCGSSTASVNVSAESNPLASISGNLIFCQGDSSLLTAFGGSTFLWSNGATTSSIMVSSSGSYTVTVNNSCGSSSASVTVTVNPALPITISGPSAFCTGDSAVLTANGGSNYVWSTGETTTSITVTTGGNYTVSGTNSCGTSTGSFTITEETFPVAAITASGATTFCQGDSVILTASGGTSFQWSNGSTAASISVTTGGTYTVTVTNTCGSSSSSITVTVNPALPITISGPSAFCTGDSATLTASGGTNYVWSTGETTASITVTTGGTYTVSGTNSCGTSTGSFTITEETFPVAAIAASGATTFCQGDSVILTASGGTSFQWSNGSISASITVTTGGTYTVTVTNSCGSSSSSITVTVNPALPITISGPSAFCTGDSAILTASGGSNYVWSTGETTASITVTTGGTYTVSGTNSCGTSTGSFTITEETFPVAAITASGAITFCQGDSVILTASGGTSFQWSNGSTAASITVTTGGTYTVTVTNTCGSSSTSITVTVNPALPITISGPTAFCTGDSATLTASGGTNYVWSTGETTTSITVTTGGNYTVSGTNACGTSTGSFTITEETFPVASNTASGATTFCQGDSVILTASGGTSFQWSNGSTSASITVTTGGTYTVTVTNTCGSSSTSITVTVNPALPITISGPSAFCTGDSAVLTANGGSNYVWSTGETTTSITVTTGGTYTVSGTNSCGTSTGSFTITEEISPVASITASGATTFCQGDSVILTASGGTSFQWSNGSTAAFITVTTGGTYTVTVTNTCGSSSTSITVTVNPALPITISGPSAFCAGDSAILTASGGSNYVWSTGETTTSITVTTGGTYTVSGTNACGTSTGSFTITEETFPVAAIAASGATTFCQGDSVILTASGGTSFQWSNGSTSASITVTTGGTYTVTVTNSCGSSSASETVTVNPPQPIVILGPSAFCTGDSAILTASGGSNYLWSTGETTTSITVTTGGTYTVSGTNACGTSTGSFTITEETFPVAAIAASGATTFCQGDSVILTASGGTSFQWSNGSTSASITVTTGGTYTVTVTNSCGSSSASETVTVNPPQPIVILGPSAFCTGDSAILTASGGSNYVWSTGETTTSITITTGGTYTVSGTNACGTSTGSFTITEETSPIAAIAASGATTFCQGDSVVLTASGGTTFQWSNGFTSASITVTTGGTYTVTVTNTCGSSSTSITVTVNPALPITISGPSAFCTGDSAVLTANGGSNYVWSTGETTTSITVTTGGNYTVSGTNACGDSTATVSITTDTLLTVSISGDSTLCPGDTLYLTATGIPPFLWSTGSSADSIAVTTAGTYSVSVSNTCGTITATQTVQFDTIPVVQITAGGPTTFCQGDSVTLTASGGSGYLWSTNDTTATITVFTAGTYTVTVTGICGTGSASQSITTDTPPVVSISGDSTLCPGDSVVLTASGNGEFVWSTGSTLGSIVVNVAGTYTVTVTNTCGTATATYVVVNDSIPVAGITAGGPTTFCLGDSVLLTATGGLVYVWSTGETTASIQINSAGTYTVTVSSSCGTSSATQVVTVDSPPVAAISGGTTFCQGDSLLLTASGGTTFLWSTGSTLGSITVNAPGNYGVTVTNACGTSAATQTVTMDSMPVAQITLSGPAIFCDGDSVILTVSGGASYLWSTGSTGNSVTITAQGTYTVTVTNNCGSATDVQSVSVLSYITIAASGPTTFCVGDSVTLTASGGAPYYWSTEETTPSITVDTAGIFWVLGTNGCPPSIDSITVVVDSVPVVTAIGDTIICKGDSVLLSAAGGLNYIWSTGDSLPQIWVGTAGTYITYSTNACGTGSDTIVVSPGGLLVKFAVDDTIGLAPFTVNFTNQSSSPYPPITYSWDFGDQTTSTEVNPQHTFTDSGSYVVTLTGTDQLGCKDTFSIVITVEGEDCFIITNIMTPNGDNLNDLFNISGLCVFNVEGRIFNRWGVELSRWKGTEKGWDGTTKGGYKVPEGSYFYIFDIELENGERLQRKGIVTLIR